MSRWLHALALVAALAGCGPKAGTTQGEAPWKSRDGAMRLRLELVESFLESNNSYQALRIVTKLREEGYDHPDLDLLHGEALLQEGVYGEAESLLVRASKTRPDHARTWRSLGTLYADSGRIELALEALREATIADPSNPAGWNNLGFLHLGNRECDTARGELEKAVSLDSTVARYRNNLALAYACTGAESDALQLMRTTGPEEVARYNLGVAYERDGKTELALSQHLLALKANPTYGPAREAVSRLQSQTESPPGVTP